jgi:hypothetical protein
VTYKEMVESADYVRDMRREIEAKLGADYRVTIICRSISDDLDQPHIVIGDDDMELVGDVVSRADKIKID